MTHHLNSNILNKLCIAHVYVLKALLEIPVFFWQRLLIRNAIAFSDQYVHFDSTCYVKNSGGAKLMEKVPQKWIARCIDVESKSYHDIPSGMILFLIWENPSKCKIKFNSFLCSSEEILPEETMKIANCLIQKRKRIKVSIKARNYSF